MTFTKAQRFNRDQAPRNLPPGGPAAFYSAPRRSMAFVQATKAFQTTAGLKADGFFGAKTFAAFELAFGGEPEVEVLDALHGPDPFDVQVWVAWANLTDEELDWLKMCGVTTLIFNLNSTGGRGRWVWDGVREKIAHDMKRAKAMGFRTIGMVWAWRSASFNEAAARHTLDLMREVGADGVQFDVEGSWVFSEQNSGLTHDGIVQAYWRPYWIPGKGDLEYSATPLYFPRPAVDALLDEPEIEINYPQAYNPWLPGDSKKAKATHADSFRAPTLQRKTLANYLPGRRRGKYKKVIVGVGGFHQRNPRQTPTQAMLASGQACHKGGADGICLWGLHTVQPGLGRRWPDEAEHRRAWEMLCALYAPGYQGKLNPQPQDRP